MDTFVTKAARLNGPRDIELIERELVCGEEDIIVKNHLMGICGSDKNFYRGYLPPKTAEFRQDPKFPFLLGHESGGTVVAVGSRVADYKVGDKVMNGAKAELKPGNWLAIKDIPVGVNICCIEMQPGRGAKIARSAGQVATLRGKEETYAQIKLPSGEVRMIHVNCHAMVGQIGNLDRMNVKMGKAGKKRYLGFRPHVRGVAMNPVDHPMGGGEGRTSGGGHPVSPWGQLAKGKRTRNPKKTSKNFIVERRKK